MYNPSIHLKELSKLQNVIKALPTQVGVETVKFFKEGFNLQGWQGDNGLEPRHYLSYKGKIINLREILNGEIKFYAITNKGSK